MKHLIFLLLLCNFAFSSITYTSTIEDIPSVVTDSFLNNSLKNKEFNLNIQDNTMCGELVATEKDKLNNIISKKKIQTEKKIIGFSADTGTFTCSYLFDNRSVEIVQKFKEYKALLKLKEENFLNSYLIDNNTIESLKNSENSSYNVLEKANEYELFSDDNFTLSQFISNLLTLNSSVVEGTTPSGDIKINAEIAEKMTILREDNSFTNFIKKNITSVYKFFTNKDNNETLDKFEVKSFQDFFDLKLFGFYYDFMSIAWQEIFEYASVGVLSIVILYSSTILMSKFSIARFKQKDEDTEQSEFNFPFRSRLIAVASILALTFLQFPSGETIEIENEKGVIETHQNQSTVAKEVIANLANVGAGVADLANEWTTVTYLKYLKNATNTNSRKEIEDMNSSLRESAKLTAINIAFYEKNCLEPYSKQIKDFKNFQSVKEDKGAWRSELKTFKYDNVSPLLCRNLETKIFNQKKLLVDLSSSIEANVSNLKGDDNDINVAHYFIESQLISSKQLGWLNVASLPIMHVFMQNSSIIENNFSMQSRGIDKLGNSKTKDLLDTSLENAGGNSDPERDSNIIVKTAKEVINFDKIASTVVSYSVYFMLPGFDRINEEVRKLIDFGAWRGMVMLRHLTGNLFMKFSKIAYKSMDFLAFFLSIGIYKILLASIFAGLLCLLIVLKIVLYFIEMFIHFFVSPFIVLWSFTVKNETHKFHEYMTDGFVIYMIKPTLIVLSSVMFIFSFEIMLSMYSLVFDIVFANLETLNLFDEADIVSVITMGAIKGLGDFGIYFFALILGYFMIFEGDKIILSKFGYKEENNELGKNFGDKMLNVSTKK